MRLSSARINPAASSRLFLLVMEIIEPGEEETFELIYEGKVRNVFYRFVLMSEIDAENERMSVDVDLYKLEKNIWYIYIQEEIWEESSDQGIFDDIDDPDLPELSKEEKDNAKHPEEFFEDMQCKKYDVLENMYNAASMYCDEYGFVLDDFVINPYAFSLYMDSSILDFLELEEEGMVGILFDGVVNGEFHRIVVESLYEIDTNTVSTNIQGIKYSEGEWYYMNEDGGWEKDEDICVYADVNSPEKVAAKVEELEAGR